MGAFRCWRGWRRRGRSGTGRSAIRFGLNLSAGQADSWLPCRLAPHSLSRLRVRAQPSGNQRSVVDKRQLTPIEVAQTTHTGQLSAKGDIPLAHAYDAGDVRATPVHDANPVTHSRERNGYVIVVGADVLWAFPGFVDTRFMLLG